ncbi:hypothetical protein D3C86_1151450 [compost metagenome]
MAFGLRQAAILTGLALTLGAFSVPALAVPIPNGEVRLQEGGYVRVTAIGLPPLGVTERSGAREVARQNAMALAQRRLLAAVLDLPVGQGKPTVRDRLEAKPKARERLRDLIARARVTGQELADGSAEVTLELPYSGPGGLAEFFAVLSP